MRGNGYDQSWREWASPYEERNPLGERVARLETRVDGMEEDIEKSQSLLEKLRDEFHRHITRSLGQILRSYWDEVLPILIGIGGALWLSPELQSRLGLWLFGAFPG